MPSFSTTLEQAIHQALALANEHRHELATLEHLLLALTEEPDAVKVMRACNVDLEDLRKTLDTTNGAISKVDREVIARLPSSAWVVSRVRPQMASHR